MRTLHISRLNACIEKSESKYDLWANVINEYNPRHFAEIGVYDGEFSERILRRCKGIQLYYMIDSWKHLDDWDKPGNVSDEQFVEAREKMAFRMRFAKDKIVVLHGRTQDVLGRIPDSFDACYVDGDHTLRGITIDLQRLYPMVRVGGWIGGDDLKLDIWHHGRDYEPTLIFPYVLYFAEAVNASLFLLPYDQFMMMKEDGESLFVDFTGKYKNKGLKDIINGIPK